MPRAKRSNEDYLEDTEPISIVILNDLNAIVEDIGEMILDIAKIQKKRPKEFAKFIAEASDKEANGQGALNALPEPLKQQVMSSFMKILGAAMAVKQEVTDPGAAAAGKQSPLAGMDPQKINPEMLEGVGRALKEESKTIEKLIQSYEKTLLKGKGKAKK
ncbi:MAG: hypothetical protein ABII22_02130 [Candidatus Micrarchaeota archaeon]